MAKKEEKKKSGSFFQGVKNYFKNPWNIPMHLTVASLIAGGIFVLTAPTLAFTVIAGPAAAFSIASVVCAGVAVLAKVSEGFYHAAKNKNKNKPKNLDKKKAPNKEEEKVTELVKKNNKKLINAYTVDKTESINEEELNSSKDLLGKLNAQFVADGSVIKKNTGNTK